MTTRIKQNYVKRGDMVEWFEWLGYGAESRQLCPRYSGTPTPTALMAITLWETFTFYVLLPINNSTGYSDEALVRDGYYNLVSIPGPSCSKHR